MAWAQSRRCGGNSGNAAEGWGERRGRKKAAQRREAHPALLFRAFERLQDRAKRLRLQQKRGSSVAQWISYAFSGVGCKPEDTALLLFCELKAGDGARDHVFLNL